MQDKGYIIYRGDYYIYQPFDLQRENLPLNYRQYPLSIKPKSVGIDDIVVDYSNMENTRNESMKNKSSMKLSNNSEMNKYIDKINVLYNLHVNLKTQLLHENKNVNKSIIELHYLYSVISTVLGHMTTNMEIEFLSYLLTKHLKEKNSDFTIGNKFMNDIYNNILNYLNMNHQLINYNLHINTDTRSHTDTEKNAKNTKNKYVGFIVNNVYYVLSSIDENDTIDIDNVDDIEFVEASSDLIYKIKTYFDIYKNNSSKNEKLFANIYGVTERTKKEKIFKIVDKSVEKEIMTKEQKKSKRAIVKGRTCSSYHIPQLLEIREKLGMYTFDHKKRQDFVCNDIEIFLRFNNIIKKNRKIWFLE